MKWNHGFYCFTCLRRCRRCIMMLFHVVLAQERSTEYSRVSEWLNERWLNYQLINQPINQSTNQSINQSTNQSINQSINHSIIQSFNHSIIQSFNQSINQSIIQWNPIKESDQGNHIEKSWKEGMASKSIEFSGMFDLAKHLDNTSTIYCSNDVVLACLTTQNLEWSWSPACCKCLQDRPVFMGHDRSHSLGNRIFFHHCFITESPSDPVVRETPRLL